VPEDADTPRVWALLGRIYADRLGDRATATRVYQHVVEGYPGTEAAAFAAAQLAALTRC
jgi:TolA-binding protein